MHRQGRQVPLQALARADKAGAFVLCSAETHVCLINWHAGCTPFSLIQEEFGDGIMSAIDFDMAIERQPDQKGDRVKFTMTG